MLRALKEADNGLMDKVMSLYAEDYALFRTLPAINMSAWSRPPNMTELERRHNSRATLVRDAIAAKIVADEANERAQDIVRDFKKREALRKAHKQKS